MTWDAVEQVTPALLDYQRKSAAARDAAGDAARDAARAAAWDAARAAAWDAAGDAAWAAAGDAAWDALAPTVDALQSSAIVLFESMILTGRNDGE
jgi:hypothetical protein